MRKNLEIPQGKRTPLYRFLEILPGAISYGAIILLFILSIVNPVLGAIYLFALIASTLVRGVGRGNPEDGLRDRRVAQEARPG